jgi:hypothetical protein
MSQFGCYIFDRLFCECGDCEACKHRLIMEGEEKSKKSKERVGKALDGFINRVNSGTYRSPEERREKAKQKLLDEKLYDYHHPKLFP